MAFSISGKYELRDPQRKLLGYYTREQLLAMCDAVYAELKSSSNDADALIFAVCEHYRILYSAIRGKSREARLAWPRHVSMFLLVEGGFSWESASKALKRKHHTSVGHALEHVKATIQTNPKRAAELLALREKLHQKETLEPEAVLPHEPIAA